MRIAILCNGRSGSTSLFNYINCCLISENKKFQSFFEPFNFRSSDIENKHKNLDKIIDKKNLLIKTFLDSSDYPYESFNSYNDYLEWVQIFFDKIILLERKDKRLQAESIAYHEKISDNGKISLDWHKPKYYDINILDENSIQQIENFLIGEANFLKKLSNSGYPLLTYEDLFIKKSPQEIEKLHEYLDLKKSEKCFNMWINTPYKKVRLPEKPNNMI